MSWRVSQKRVVIWGEMMCVYRVTRVHTKRQASRRTRVKISRKESPGRRVETLYSEKKVEKKGV